MYLTSAGLLDLSLSFMVEIVAFIVMVLILARWVYPRVMAAAEARQLAVAEQLSAAEKAREEAERRLRDAEAQLREARSQASGIIEGANKTAEQLSADARRRAEEEGKRIADNARKDRDYARRLLYKDPAERFSAVVMVWDPGQGTPIHDHCGMWCVECVVLGRIRVSQFDMIPFTHGPLVEFREAGVITAGIGEAGALIPPFDYHKIENVFDTKAATIHVYGGEMLSCTAFLPEGGRYRYEYCDLSYTPD